MRALVAVARVKRFYGAANSLGISSSLVSRRIPTSSWDVRMPFGRGSGSAFKEQGLDVLCFYTRTKTVAVAFGA